MVLDTGCTHTVIHTHKAKKLGFKPSKKNKNSGIMTASGAIDSYSFSYLFFQALGITFENKSVQVADVDVSNEYAGYLGLDFFEGKKFTIDLPNQTIEIIE